MVSSEIGSICVQDSRGLGRHKHLAVSPRLLIRQYIHKTFHTAMSPTSYRLQLLCHGCETLQSMA